MGMILGLGGDMILNLGEGDDLIICTFEVNYRCSELCLEQETPSTMEYINLHFIDS